MKAKTRNKQTFISLKLMYILIKHFMKNTLFEVKLKFLIWIFC